MSRIMFNTGVEGPHQRDMIWWVRKRLSDARGRQVRDANGSRWQQSAVLIADGVGMGKTWEALGAAAVLLYRMGRKRHDGEARSTTRRRLGRVLIIVPPGLTDKWQNEINSRDKNRFNHYLREWWGGKSQRQWIWETLSEADIVQRQRDFREIECNPGTFDIGEGVFVVSSRIFRSTSRTRKLDALLRAKWDIVIIDEAHRGEHRQLLEDDRLLALSSRWQKKSHLILLSATPFQLRLSELRRMADHLVCPVSSEAGLFTSPAIKAYVASVRALSEGQPPDRRAVTTARRAGELLRHVVARSRPRGRGVHRHYHLIGKDGNVHRRERLPTDPAVIGKWLETGGIEPNHAFEAWYLGHRIRLSGSTQAGRPNFVASSVRQLLSTPGQARRVTHNDPPPTSPRLDALQKWGRRSIETGLHEAMRDGFPRKSLIFTTFVNPAGTELAETMDKSVREAVWAVQKQYPRWEENSQRTIDAIADDVTTLVSNLHLAHNPIDTLNCGLRDNEASLHLLLLSTLASRRCLRREIKAVRKRWLETDKESMLREWGWTRGEAPEKYVARAGMIVRTVNRETKWFLESLANTRQVVRYDGNASRPEKARAMYSFQSLVGPWIMVASRAGAEGIDLHTWTRNLVHFDLEWNPAVMEQREGRCDRIGRRLTDPLDIHYMVVRGTYDERMLHQVAVRQQWHRLVLGLGHDSPVYAEGDLPESYSAGQQGVDKLELDLSPR